MLHACRSALIALALGLADPGGAFAQSTDTWPSYTGVFPTQPLEFVRGPGFYLNLLRIVLCWLVFLAWVRSADWINQDAQRLKNNFNRWNQLALFSFVAMFVLVWVLPWFWVSFPLLLVAFAAPLALYVRDRNAKVNQADQVFTREHLRFWLANRLRPLGVKIATEAKAPVGPPINLTARGGATDRDDSANLFKAKQSSGFNPCGYLLVDAFQKRAGAMMLDFAKENLAAMKYQVDGVWTDAPVKDVKSADAILGVMKMLSGLNSAERVARQRGTFGAEYEKTRYVCRFQCQGTKVGERALLNFDDGKSAKLKLPDMGMPEKNQEALRALVGQKRGFVIVSAPPAGGLTTLLNATGGAIDRFMRSVVGIEEASAQDTKVENVPITTFDAAAGQTPATVLPGVIRQYPDAYVIPDLVDAATVGILCGEVAEDRLVVAGIRAKDAAESLLRVLMLKVPLKQFVPVVSGAVNQRLVRKLCDTCKESYNPGPQVLQQLAAAGQQVDKIYRPPQPPPADAKKEKPPCADCRGVGYRGRTGIFEVLVVDDNLRTVLLKQPQLEHVRLAARKAGMRTLQQQGAALVAQGVTSLEELIRALKE
jgi:type II secretory ATPase GspE/PulE/Tfp pilus assembly ATPase PilB-like protein